LSRRQGLAEMDDAVVDVLDAAVQVDQTVVDFNQLLNNFFNKN
jgi:hypothetical protein